LFLLKVVYPNFMVPKFVDLNYESSNNWKLFLVCNADEMK